MSGDVFAHVGLAETHADLMRNIVSLRVSQDLFDDLSDRPADWDAAIALEVATKPPAFTSAQPVLHRPFEEARWNDAIHYPFRHWMRSRYSDGSFGVWYGADSVKTTVHETVHHWVHGLIRDAGFEHEPVVAERKVYAVTCRAVLLDFRDAVRTHPELLDPDDTRAARAVGARLQREGHPGLMIPSVRHPAGLNHVLFTPTVLSDVRLNCQLSYRLEGGRVRVEKRPGTAWLVLPVAIG